MIITIDGPTASGKSTVAMLVAQKLGYYYLNSGLLYRAFGYILLQYCDYSIEQVYHPADEDIRTYLLSGRISYACDKQTRPGIWFDGNDITPYLKGARIDQVASVVSSDARVRQALLGVQRDIGRAHDLVIDGRDAGTVVFPDADYKFYLTAPLEVRAARWMQEQHARGNTYSLQEAVSQIAIRDERDMLRTIAPLRVPETATIVDNGQLTIEQTVDVIYELIQPKLRAHT